MGLKLDPEIDELSTMLGMGLDFLRSLNGMEPHAAQRRLEHRQTQLDIKFKEAAFELHPDRNLDDPDATRRFAMLSSVRDQLAALSILSTRGRRSPIPVESIIKTPTDDELRKYGDVEVRGTRVSFFS